MELKEIKEWLVSKGFVSIDHDLYQKEKVRVVFLKTALRLEIFRSGNWERFSGTYYKRIFIDETGLMRCIGLFLHKGLYEYIMDKQFPS